MRQRKTVLMWVLAVALVAALPVTQALADPPVLPAEKVKTSPGNIPPVPRGMPNLTPYWNFDPPKSPLFDISKLSISGDMRFRYEIRNNGNFGVGKTTPTFNTNTTSTNESYAQQWMRLGFNYAISPDVDFFVQEQYAKTYGATATSTCGAGICANDAFHTGTAGTLFTRQAWMMIRNVGIDGLSLKVGRQLLVMGNHRLFGHFDWVNTGFSHDGITFQYNQPMYEIWGGWVRLAENDIGAAAAIAVPGVGGAKANNDADLFFTRLAFKPMAGLAIEPLWVFLNNKQPAGAGGVGGGVGSAGNSLFAHANDQNRHTLGGRVAFKQGMFDATGEYYWQTGSMGLAGSGDRLRINANALAVVAGVTLKDAPMQPRFGLEFNYASGDGDANNCNSTTGAGCNGTANTFENFYPTNHILMGYADLMAWKNMVGYSADIQLKPTKESHFETKFWIFRKANNNDCWYRAAQNCFSTQSATNGLGVATSNSLYKELDFIYTLFFKNNQVAWQTGASYLWAGEAVQQVAAGDVNGNGPGAVNQVWGYTQLHINF